jgi:hypothetical protein
VLATGAVGVAGLALAPLALYQRSHTPNGAWISALPFRDRLRHVPYLFVTGLDGVGLQRAVLVATCVVLGLALFYLLRRVDSQTRSSPFCRCPWARA